MQAVASRQLPAERGAPRCQGMAAITCTRLGWAFAIRAHTKRWWSTAGRLKSCADARRPSARGAGQPGLLRLRFAVWIGVLLSADLELFHPRQGVLHHAAVGGYEVGDDTGEEHLESRHQQDRGEDEGLHTLGGLAHYKEEVEEAESDGEADEEGEGVVVFVGVACLFV